MADKAPRVTGAGATGDTPRDQVEDALTVTDTAPGDDPGLRVEGGGLAGDHEGPNPGTPGHPGAPGYGTPPAE